MAEHNWDVIVVGGGISGLVAADALKQAGKSVLVLEKSKGLGGRAATRRVGFSAVPVNLGVESFTVRDAGFKKWLLDVEAKEGTSLFLKQGDRFTARAGITDLFKRRFARLGVRRQSRVVGIRVGAAGEWRVSLEGGAVETARSLVMAVPVVQGLELLGSRIDDHALEVLLGVQYTSQVSLIIKDEITVTRILPDGDAGVECKRIYLKEDASHLRVWVLTPEASRAYFADPSLTPHPSIDIQRWRYARVKVRAQGVGVSDRPHAFRFSQVPAAFWVGDAFGASPESPDAAFEGAFLSGMDVIRTIS